MKKIAALLLCFLLAGCGVPWQAVSSFSVPASPATVSSAAALSLPPSAPPASSSRREPSSASVSHAFAQSLYVPAGPAPLDIWLESGWPQVADLLQYVGYELYEQDGRLTSGIMGYRLYRMDGYLLSVRLQCDVNDEVRPAAVNAVLLDARYVLENGLHVGMTMRGAG